MRDWIDIGSSPPGEPCAQLGSDGYYDHARRECKEYIALLRRTLGPEPDGAALRIRSNEHDFGTYLSVACYYDPSIEEAIDYAFQCESQGPDDWDQEARAALSRGRRKEKHR